MTSIRTCVTTVLLLLNVMAFAQSKDEAKLLKLSARIFKWEVESKFDSLENILADRLVVLNSAGATQTKVQYLARLKGGNFVHNDIEVEQNAAVVSGNTGTVTGKGWFNISANGKQSRVHLTYMEVFARSSSGAGWTLLGLHASVIPD